MSKYSTLKAEIIASIKRNGAQAITGDLLQEKLLSMIDSLGEHYQFGGLALPSTEFTPGDEPVVFIAATPGTYTDFGGFVVDDSEVALLVWDGSAWSKQTTDIATRAEVSQLGQNLNNTGLQYYVVKGWLDTEGAFTPTPNNSRYLTLVCAVDENKKYKYYSGPYNAPAKYAFYDSDGAVLSAVTPSAEGWISLTPPAGAVLFRACIKFNTSWSDAAMYKCCFVEESSWTKYLDRTRVQVSSATTTNIADQLEIDGVPYNLKDGVLTQEVSAINSRIGGATSPLTITENGGYVSWATHLIVENANYFYSDPISLNKGDKISLQGWVYASGAAISLYANGTYYPVVQGADASQIYTYTAIDDCKVVVSGFGLLSHSVSVTTADKVGIAYDYVMAQGEKNILDFHNSGQLSSIVSPFNSTYNLKAEFYVKPTTRNKCFNFYQYSYINKSTGVITLVKNSSDDTAPVRLTNLSYVGAQHGFDCTRRCASTGHDKTYADIGSTWLNNGQTFTLVAVETNYLTFVSQNFSVYPNCSYGYPRKEYPLTHVSGATHTGDITITDVSWTQWLPVCASPSIHTYIDGKEITTDGVYSFKKMEVVESYDILNPESVMELLRQNVGTFSGNPTPEDFAAGADKMLRLNVQYTFNSAAECCVTTNIIFFQAVNLNYFGFSQANPMDDTNLKVYIPKAKSLNNGADSIDFRTIVSATGYNGNIMTNDWENPLLPPDRFMQFNDVGAFWMGYLFDYGVGGNNRASALNNIAYYISTTGAKMYPYGVQGDGSAENTLSKYSAVCFRKFIDRAKVNVNGIISAFTIEYGGAVYVYADFNAAGMYDIELPESCFGKAVEVFEKRDNVELLNNVATDRLTINVASDSVMYGYLVAKILI